MGTRLPDREGEQPLVGADLTYGELVKRLEHIGLYENGGSYRIGIESRGGISFEDGSQPRRVAPATVDEDEPLAQPSAEPVVAPTPPPVVKNAVHHYTCGHARSWNATRDNYVTPSTTHHSITWTLYGSPWGATRS